MEVDFLIVGQGLAGSALAMALMQRGKSILVVDDGAPSAATRVAAGLVTTLAGKAMNPAWRQAEYLPEARSFYSMLERQSGRKLFYEHPVLRLFTDAKEVAKFEKKLPIVREWVEEVSPEVEAAINAPYGGFSMAQSGRLDTLHYLEVVRQMIVECGEYRKTQWLENEVELLESGVKWRDVRAEKVILCQGYESLKNGWFSDLPHRSAKGEMLTVKVKELEQNRILNRNGWMVPLEGGLWRAGATYEWDDLSTQSTTQGVAEVQKKIEGLISCEYSVVSHEVGVRPIIQRSQPVVGMHRLYPQVGIFNGLGSKGVITAPSVGEHFAAFLCEECALDLELDVARLES